MRQTKICTEGSSEISDHSPAEGPGRDQTIGRSCQSIAIVLISKKVNGMRWPALDSDMRSLRKSRRQSAKIKEPTRRGAQYGRFSIQVSANSPG